MPELPEVETMVRDLATRVLGLRIESVDIQFDGSVAWPGPIEFRERLEGQTIGSLGRRGKYASVCLTSGDALIIHRGMTGSLLFQKQDEPHHRHNRVIFRLNGGHELRFRDMRKFGRLYVMEASGEERALPWAKIGPEPLDGSFSLAGFRRALMERRGLVKPLLLTQRLVAGLGNIYVDEALFLARIHPSRRACTLAPREIQRLHKSIQDVLAAAVDGRGTTFQSYVDIRGRAGRFQSALLVFRRQGESCSRCGTQIEKIVVGGRGTHICPRCQKV